jgi:hypothetical protein
MSPRLLRRSPDKFWRLARHPGGSVTLWRHDNVKGKVMIRDAA